MCNVAERYMAEGNFTSERFRITGFITANSKHQIQVDDFSKKEMKRQNCAE